MSCKNRYFFVRNEIFKCFILRLIKLIIPIDFLLFILICQEICLKLIILKYYL